MNRRACGVDAGIASTAITAFVFASVFGVVCLTASALVSSTAVAGCRAFFSCGSCAFVTCCRVVAAFVGCNAAWCCAAVMIGACCSVVVWHAAVAIGCAVAFCRAAVVFGGCVNVCCNAALFGASVVRAVSAFGIVAWCRVVGACGASVACCRAADACGCVVACVVACCRVA